MIETRTPNSQFSGDSLAGGFYTLSEAAHLLGLQSQQSVARWISGSEPVILRQYEKTGAIHEIGFLDLLEIRFIDHFRKQKISLQSLRVAARNARRELKVDHPFALNAKFQTDRKNVFLETAKQTGDRELLNLMNNQIEIYEVIESLIARDLTFDISSGLAKQWQPRPADCPSVVINPLYAFGRPVVSEKHVPTASVFKLFKAEHGDFAAVADWFDLAETDARQAVEFEIRLAA